jgi:outer membrane protein OmpA-like peptidoglycan-associated protein
MLTQFGRRAGSKSEGERPFWISYADFMTAMMTTCLVAMAVAILAATQQLKKKASAEEDRVESIREVCQEIEGGLSNNSIIHINCQSNRIDFGVAGRFDYKEYRLRADGESALAVVVPLILKAAASSAGQRWLKQVVIEGYTDTKGSYLYNLYLSLQRSYWVMCNLVDPARNAQLGLSADQVQQVRDLFLAGGVSFNDAQVSDDASRRVELRLEFFPLGENRSQLERARIQDSDKDECTLK